MNDRVALPTADSEAVRTRCLELIPQLDAVQSDTSDAAATLARAAMQELVAVPSERTCYELVDCLLAIAHQCYIASDVSAAVCCTARAVDDARQLGDQRQLRKALTFHGVMLKMLGNYAGAIDALVESIEIARAIQDPVQEAPAWNNLGTVLMTTTQYVDAMACFGRAAELASGETSFVATQAHSNAASCALRLNALHSGIEYAQRSIALNAAPVGAMAVRARAIAETHLCRLLLRVDAIDAARSHADAAARFHSLSPSGNGAVDVAVTSALLKIASGAVDEGTAALRAASVTCRRQFRYELHEVLGACVDGFEAAGQNDVALTYLHELLALNRESKGQALVRQLEAVAADIRSHKSWISRSQDPTASRALDLATAVDRALEDLINAAVTASEQAGHDRLRIFRVSRLAELFVAELGWAADLDFIGLAARLVDIGTLVVPTELLQKERGLSGAERRIVHEHTQFGADILTRARLAILQPCVEVVRYHHERWDGTGAWALTGDGIPVGARVVALCDAFDALTHERPWRKALSPQAALRIIASEAGTKFDPDLAASFVRFVRHEFWNHDDFDAFLAEDADQNAYVRTRAQIQRLLGAGT